jgi:hypothetical protein
MRHLIIEYTSWNLIYFKEYVYSVYDFFFYKDLKNIYESTRMNFKNDWLQA